MLAIGTPPETPLRKIKPRDTLRLAGGSCVHGGTIPAGLIFTKKYVILYDMKDTWTLIGRGDRLEKFVGWGGGRKEKHTVCPVLTLKDVCERLAKSQRQVYRYVQEGRLRPCAKILDQWLFDADEIAGFEKFQQPRFLRPFFWDVHLSSLSPVHHRDFILGRLLEFGNQAAVSWMFQVYSRREVVQFLANRGADILSRRAWRFWTVVLKAPHRRPASWRQRGRRWGGIR